MPNVPAFTWDVDVSKKSLGGIPYTEHVADFVMFSRSEEKYLPNGRMVYSAPQNYFVQRGHIYDAAGRYVPVDEAPEWVLEEYRRTNPETRRVVGLLLPEDQEFDAAQSVKRLAQEFDNLSPEVQDQLRALLAGQAPRKAEKAPKSSGEASDTSALHDGLKNDSEGSRPKTWTCDECGQDEDVTKKGVHIARHRRAAKAAAKAR